VPGRSAPKSRRYRAGRLGAGVGIDARKAFGFPRRRCQPAPARAPQLCRPCCGWPLPRESGRLGSSPTPRKVSEGVTPCQQLTATPPRVVTVVSQEWPNGYLVRSERAGEVSFAQPSMPSIIVRSRPARKGTPPAALWRIMVPPVASASASHSPSPPFPSPPTATSGAGGRRIPSSGSAVECQREGRLPAALVTIPGPGKCGTTSLLSKTSPYPPPPPLLHSKNYS